MGVSVTDCVSVDATTDSAEEGDEIGWHADSIIAIAETIKVNERISKRSRSTAGRLEAPDG